MSDRICSVDGCKDGSLAKGMCQRHYDRNRRNGSPHISYRVRRKNAEIADLCEIEGCDKPYKANGMCAMHYYRVRQHGSVGVASPTLQPQKGFVCSIAECERPCKAQGKCQRHYRLALRQANVEKSRAEVIRRRTQERANGVFQVLDREMARLYLSPCTACGAMEQIEADHIIPIARGGHLSIGNLQPLCRSCNASKNDKLPIEWRVWRDKLAGPSVGAA